MTRSSGSSGISWSPNCTPRRVARVITIAVAQRAVGDEPLEVHRLVARHLGVVRGDVLAPEHVREAFHPHVLAQVLEEAVQEDHPPDVELAWRDARHLPVEHADRREVAEHHVADARVAPAEHRRRARRRLPASARRASRTRARAAGTATRRAPTRSTPARGRHDAATRCRPASGNCRKSSSSRFSVVPCTPASTSTAPRSSATRCSSVASVTQLPIGYGITSGGHDPVDPPHDEELRTEWLVRRLVEHDLRNRHGRALPDQTNDPRLARHVVLTEDLVRVLCRVQPGDELARDVVDPAVLSTWRRTGPSRSTSRSPTADRDS